MKTTNAHTFYHWKIEQQNPLNIPQPLINSVMESFRSEQSLTKVQQVTHEKRVDLIKADKNFCSVSRVGVESWGVGVGY